MSKDPKRPKATLRDTVVAVLWSFLGVRRKSDFQEDIVKLNPIHLMITGFVLCFVFVIALMLISYWVVS